MPIPSDLGEDYFINWQGDLRANQAGDGARRKSAELRQQRTLGDAFADAVLGRRDAGWSWAKGAAGRRRSRTLASLPPTHWRVLHDLPISDRGANVDHLVLGPPGVFSLNTKHLSGRVEVRREEVRRHCRATGYIQAAIREAEWVRAVLESQTGEPVMVEPLLVIYGADVRVNNQPRNVTVRPTGRRSAVLDQESRIPDSRRPGTSASDRSEEQCRLPASPVVTAANQAEAPLPGRAS